MARYLHEDARYREFIEKDVKFCNIFLMFENTSNLCWLDSSLCILIHNHTIKHLSECFPQSVISIIRRYYLQAMFLINDYFSSLDPRTRIDNTVAKLLSIQSCVLNLLQPTLKFDLGMPESAFCALLNLLKLDKAFEEHFHITYDLIRDCCKCGVSVVNKQLTKPILTLPKVHSFHPENPIIIHQCPNCKIVDQKLKVVFTIAPSCIIFHFENGAGNEGIPLSFALEMQNYSLIAVMTLESIPDSTSKHFVSWIRYPGGENTKFQPFRDMDSCKEQKDKWLECNDLKLNVHSFRSVVPNIDCKTVYMCVYQAFDSNNEAVTVKKTLKVQTPSLQISKNSIICIDISDDSDSNMSHSELNLNANSAYNSKSHAEQVDDKDQASQFNTYESPACDMIKNMKETESENTVAVESKRSGFTIQQKKFKSLVNYLEATEKEIKLKTLLHKATRDAKVIQYSGALKDDTLNVPIAEIESCPLGRDRGTRCETHTVYNHSSRCSNIFKAKEKTCMNFQHISKTHGDYLESSAVLQSASEAVTTLGYDNKNIKGTMKRRSKPANECSSSKYNSMKEPKPKKLNTSMHSCNSAENISTKYDGAMSDGKHFR